MILKLFSIRDVKVEAFMTPFFAPTNGSALRMFADTIADSQSIIAKHPEDYALFEIGIWNDADGSLKGLSQPVPLGLAMEYVAGGKELARGQAA